jgi:hypothetical protein
LAHGGSLEKGSRLLHLREPIQLRKLIALESVPHRYFTPNQERLRAAPADTDNLDKGLQHRFHARERN